MALHTKWSSGDLIFYDGTQDIFTIKNSTGGILVGESDLGIDFTFYGATTGAYMKWDESEDEFDIAATVEMQGTSKIQFGTTGSYIHETTGSQLDIVTTGTLYLNGEVTNPAPTQVSATGATLSLTVASNRFQFFEDTSGTNLELPSATGGTAVGIQFFIARGSTSTGTLSVYDGSTASGDLVAEIAQYESGILINDGTQWKGIVGTAT